MRHPVAFSAQRVLQLDRWFVISLIGYTGFFLFATHIFVEWFLGGVSSIIDMIIALTRSALNLDFGILGLFVGIGLLRFSRGWRTCALVSLWIAMIGLPLAALVFLFSATSAHYTFFGQNTGQAPRWVGVVLAAALFAFVWWQYRVLTRPDIRKLFGLSA